MRRINSFVGEVMSVETLRLSERLQRQSMLNINMHICTGDQTVHMFDLRKTFNPIPRSILPATL